MFLARGGAPYELAVGSDSINDGSLPLTTLVPGYEPKRLASMGEARLKGTLQAPAAAVPATVATADTQWKRYGLWALLLAGVGLLALMALSLLRSSRQTG